MKRPVRNASGNYVVHGKSYKELFGSRTQVHNKTAYKTPGGLTRSDLMMNKWGRIVSAKKHRTAKKEKRLEKAGYFAKKGKFGYVKKTARRSRKMKGGNGMEGNDDDATAGAEGVEEENKNKM
uniref:Uncharacterized protein n=1 Tax=viral metagenome TaxID=1070528 RepID=A0A6C0JI32_9ZZZZ